MTIAETVKKLSETVQTEISMANLRSYDELIKEVKDNNELIKEEMRKQQEESKMLPSYSHHLICQQRSLLRTFDTFGRPDTGGVELTKQEIDQNNQRRNIQLHKEAGKTTVQKVQSGFSPIALGLSVVVGLSILVIRYHYYGDTKK
eukprot:GHVP01028436.1.p1 GENE.GHVP01028436.1~~GHVP01028436.1.p1  ORF type:complete len:146 (+),score=26.81 GHVP01028436.1:21-458(+)